MSVPYVCCTKRFEDHYAGQIVKGGKTIGKEVLMTGSRVASDVLSGENFKEAVKTRSKESGKKLAQKAIDRVQSMVGKGQYKRKRKKQKN
ncbi:uncharacterized protein TNCV_3825051 [Trichonephila clavipes]|nr:uncharacterized protein TNCV_3825051 [Trichonephila clavipes]